MSPIEGKPRFDHGTTIVHDDHRKRRSGALRVKRKPDLTGRWIYNPRWSNRLNQLWRKCVKDCFGSYPSPIAVRQRRPAIGEEMVVAGRKQKVRAAGISRSLRRSLILPITGRCLVGRAISSDWHGPPALSLLAAHCCLSFRETLEGSGREPLLIDASRAGASSKNLMATEIACLLTPEGVATRTVIQVTSRLGIPLHHGELVEEMSTAGMT